MPEKKDLFNLNEREKDKQKDQRNTTNVDKHEMDERIKATEIKDAHASGIGALGRSEENQLENLSNNEAEKDEDVY